MRSEVKGEQAEEEFEAGFGRETGDVGRGSLKESDVFSGVGKSGEDGHRSRARTENDYILILAVRIVWPELRVNDLTTEIVETGDRSLKRLVIAVVSHTTDDPLGRDHL